MLANLARQRDILRHATPIRLSFWIAALLAVCLSLYLVGREAATDPELSWRLAQPVDFPALNQVQGAAIDELVPMGAQGIELALRLEGIEHGIRDLAVLVLASNLTTKVPLGEALVDCAVDAKAAARSLRKISLRIAATLNDVRAVNTHALHSLRTLHAVDPAAVRPDISNGVVAQVFEVSTQTFFADLDDIAAASAGALYELRIVDERLSVIDGVISVTFPREGILAHLGLVGPDPFAGWRKQIAVLRDAQDCLIASTLYVHGIIRVLVQMKGNLGVLQERLTAGMTPATSLDVQLASVERVLYRMMEAMWRLDSEEVGK